MSENIVESPDNALWCVGQMLNDAADSTEAIFITIHQKYEKVVGNVWLSSRGNCSRFLPEMVYQEGPNRTLMICELTRLVQLKHDEIHEDDRMKSVLLGLQSKIRELMIY